MKTSTHHLLLALFNLAMVPLNLLVGTTENAGIALVNAFTAGWCLAFGLLARTWENEVAHDRW